MNGPSFLSYSLRRNRAAHEVVSFLFLPQFLRRPSFSSSRCFSLPRSSIPSPLPFLIFYSPMTKLHLQFRFVICVERFSDEYTNIRFQFARISFHLASWCLNRRWIIINWRMVHRTRLSIRNVCIDYRRWKVLTAMVGSGNMNAITDWMCPCIQSKRIIECSISAFNRTKLCKV